MVLSEYTFNTIEKTEIRKNLLLWYNDKKRTLPWRKEHTEFSNKNDFAYAVWVSEVMLQQTKVATVIDYYNRWMLKWPTVSSLAKASQEEVNRMWAGLGYYSRGRRLFEGACKVMENLNGEIPTDSSSLFNHLPGVGRYTAAAIASIVFNESVGVLDGNVVRVLCRMRAIGGNTSSKEVNKHLWSLSNLVIDPNKPGDFNQALMELGATVCTPKKPLCSSCPVRSHCKAYSKTKDHGQERKLKLISVNESKLKKEPNKNSESDHEVTDVEDCVDSLALPFFDPQLGVENYPQKRVKKAPRSEHVIVVLIESSDDEAGCGCSDSQFLMSKRPDSGLLAGLWEFPNRNVTGLESHRTNKKRKHSSASANQPTVQCQTAQEIASETLKRAGSEPFQIEQSSYVGAYTHKFSHIHQTNYIYNVKAIACCVPPPPEQSLLWVSESAIQDLPKPTLVVNIFKLFSDSRGDLKAEKVRSKITKNKNKKQNIESFFTKKEIR